MHELQNTPGSTLGRQIKRELFKLSIYHFLWGFIVFIISIYQATDIGRINGYFYEAGNMDQFHENGSIPTSLHTLSLSTCLYPILQ